MMTLTVLAYHWEGSSSDVNVVFMVEFIVVSVAFIKVNAIGQRVINLVRKLQG